jgi:hypothetical protein
VLLSLPELPLRSGRISPLQNLSIASGLRSGDTATQAMALTRDGRRDARLVLHPSIHDDA